MRPLVCGLILTMGLPAVVSAQIFQCEQANGQVEFSDTACSPDAQIITVDPARIGGRFDTGTDVKLWQPPERTASREYACPQGYINSTKMRTFRVRKQVRQGMSSKQVRYILGDPDQQQGLWWIYEHKGEETGRYEIKNGCLARVR